MATVTELYGYWIPVTIAYTTKNGAPSKKTKDVEGRRTSEKRPNERRPLGARKTPTVGLEPTTTRLRALRSAD